MTEAYDRAFVAEYTEAAKVKYTAVEHRRMQAYAELRDRLEDAPYYTAGKIHAGS
jgi:hypothetical protein